MKKFKNFLKEFAQHLFYFLLRPFLWFYIVVFQHVRFKRNHKKVPKGPVLFLSNHLSNWDGIYINAMFWNRIVHFIVHDEMFKNKFLGFLSNVLLGEVKRGMSTSDISDILTIRQLVKKGKSVGLYPEGDIDMFGRTLPVEISVAKFVKMLRIPVVIMRIDGACIRATRWGKYAHHSHITYSIREVLSVEQIQKMSLEELYKVIMDGITVDDLAYQENVLRYKQWPGPARAEWLELGLYMCPKCHRLEVLKSKGAYVYCSECGFKAKYNRYAMLEGEEVPFHNLTKWDDWQYSELKKIIDQAEEKGLILATNDLDLYHVKEVEFFKKPIGRTDLKLYKDRIVYQENGEEITLYIQDMTRLMLQYKDVLEIHFGTSRIRFRTERRKWSAYLYWKALLYIKKNLKKEN